MARTAAVAAAAAAAAVLLAVAVNRLRRRGGGASQPSTAQRRRKLDRLRCVLPARHAGVSRCRRRRAGAHSHPKGEAVARHMP
jgi:hypothetical protein